LQPKELITLAAAHGADIIGAARTANPMIPRDVLMKRFQGGRIAPVYMQPPDNRARGKQTPTSVRPTWTLAELGQACKGVPKIPYRAALYAYAGDMSDYWLLQKALTYEAEKYQRWEHWPDQVLDIHTLEIPYLPHLAKLVLDEDAMPNLFRVCPPLYAIYLHISEETWETQIAERFEILKLTWLDWIAQAMWIMQPRLEEHPQ
jgi:hypothetical protein